MKPGSFRVEFEQAAIGDDADVLGQILVPQFNLAVWRKAGEQICQSGYIQSLNLGSLGRNLLWQDGYFKTLFTSAIPPLANRRDETINILRRNLAAAGFPAKAPSDRKSYHETFTRYHLASALYDFSQHFARAVGKSSRITLLVFRSDDNHFWHTDSGHARGIITLRGNEGTIWRPDSSLTGETCASDIYWGDVEPETQDFIQSIQPGDMAVFKCRDHKNPLVHATPSSNDSRLVAIMGSGPS